MLHSGMLGRESTRSVADVLLRHVGYATALAFVRQLRREGFDRNSRVPAERTLQAAELRRLPATCDVDATAARLGLKASHLRRYLRRRRQRRIPS